MCFALIPATWSFLQGLQLYAAFVYRPDDGALQWHTTLSLHIGDLRREDNKLVAQGETIPETAMA